MSLESLSATELAGRVRAGGLSPVDIVRALLRRIERLEPHLHAWVTIDAEGALEEARRLEQEIARGRSRGPLAGVPIGMKDIIRTRDLRTTMGSRVFESYIPTQDAPLVRRLRKAGAIILGKTVTSEFATLDPGPTCNPWNVRHTPGGSSSGSAAAVAAQMCPVATGSQTAGSIGRPAAFCGIVGLMPTASRIPTEGVFPAAWSLDHIGAFGRTVDDVAAMTEAMSGAPFAKKRRPPAPRIGVLRDFFEEKTDRAAWDAHTAFLEKIKAHTVELELPEVFSVALPALWTIMRSEVAATHERLYLKHGQQYGPRVRGFVESGLVVPATDYLRARRIRRIYQAAMRRLFDGCDILVTPGARGPAPLGLDTTGDPVLSAPWTLADFPTLTLPLTLDNAGLPIGIQLTAPPLEEPRLLAIGRWLESVIGFREAPKLPE